MSDLANNKMGAIANKNKMRLPKRMAVVFVVWFICGMFFFGRFGNTKCEKYDLTDDMVCDVYYTDGTSKHVDSKEFGGLKKGDVIELYTTIPEDLNIEDPSIYLPVYNTMLEVYLNDELLYKDDFTKEDMSEHYGHNIYAINLPDDNYYGKLFIRITAIVTLTDEELDDLSIISAADEWRIILNKREFVFCLAISLMVISTVCAAYFIYLSIARKSLYIGLSLSAFELAINVWFFGSMGMFYVLFGQCDFSRQIEYYALYFAPIPLGVFIYQTVTGNYKKVTLGFLSLYVLSYIITTVIELLPLNINYSDMIMVMHLGAAILLALLVISTFNGTNKANSDYIEILKFGSIVSMVLWIEELIRYNLLKYLFNSSWSTSLGISTLAIMTLAISLIIYIVCLSAEEYTIKVEKEKILALAYKDALTGIPNRAACYKDIEEMEAAGLKDYTMIFYDLNDLKKANDKYGHDIGDKLLTIFGDIISGYKDLDGFYGRWGGDEFITCIIGNETESEKYISYLEERIKMENEAHTFPFELSVAYGVVHSSYNNYIDVIEAIRTADASMYRTKSEMKKKFSI